jgi:hypothetical protein
MCRTPVERSPQYRYIRTRVAPMATKGVTDVANR